MSDTGEELARMADEIARLFETFAEQFEQLMPSISRVRDAVSGIAPGVQRMQQLEGSVDAVDALLQAGLGLDRIDAARRRILAALADPMDDAPR